jgi:hypothetical protein
MKVYTYSQARQNLATLLEQAAVEGEVWIKRQDGQVFAVRPEVRRESPLDVKGVDLGLTAGDIVQFVQEGRREAEGSGLADREDARVSANVYALNEAREAAYREMAQDREREEDALESAEGTIGDVSPSQGDESPCGNQRIPDNRVGR